MRRYKLNPRGIGVDSGLCLICGRKVTGPNFASFVSYKEQGEAIMKLFDVVGGNARLDYRPSEPNWIQVKIVACEHHEASLNALYNSIVNNENTITAEAIVRAFNIAGVSDV